MARKRPSLKDYLTTGKVFVDAVSQEAAPDAAPVVAVEPGPAAIAPAPPKPPEVTAPPRILGMLGDADREQWTSLFSAAVVEEYPIGDLPTRRDEFRMMDRNRYTLFLLEAPSAALVPVRTSVRIREPLAALLLWDENGRATVYYAGEPS
jgi:hypothetical protein